MPIDPSYNKKIHHITHYSNLSKIIHSGCMLSSNEFLRLRAT